jgi:hypothetical protein
VRTAGPPAPAGSDSLETEEDGISVDDSELLE